MTAREKFNEFVKENGHEPKYAYASIIWLDSKEQEDCYCFKLSEDVDPKTDDAIFFYLRGINDIESFFEEGAEDFIILEDSVEFTDEI